MDGIKIVGTFDVTEMVFLAFMLFFIALVFYLRREDRREGYPLEDEVTGRVDTAGGALLAATPKTFHMPFGRGTVTTPTHGREKVDIAGARTFRSPGAPYYPTGNPLYEAFSGTTFGGTTFNQNPNTIATQNITLKIPANPVMASTHSATPMGVIGVALNGVPFFNQYAAGNSPLTNEMTSFDKYWGHPQMQGMYHYHVEPLYLTTVIATKSSLMGFLLDGFPVYGPQETGGSAPSTLDDYHGHTHATVEYPGGIYHYHFSTAAPYLNGNGFWGTAGTVTQ